MSGSTKVFGFSKSPSPDIAEYFWMLKLSEIKKMVQSEFSQGIRFTVILEDLGRHYLSYSSTHETQRRIDEYFGGLVKFAGLGQGSISIQLESEILANQLISPEVCDKFGLTGTASKDNFFLLADQLKELFRQYWMDSNSDPESKKCLEYESYLDLNKIGFRGTIPTIQREYYLQRSNSCCDIELSPDENLERVLRYLGAAFARKLLGVVKPDVFDEEGPVSPIQVSFVPHAPGTPEFVQRNRIEQLCYLRSKKSCRGVAPWAGYGAIDVTDRRYTIFSTREIENRHGEFQTLKLPHNSVDPHLCDLDVTAFVLNS